MMSVSVLIVSFYAEFSCYHWEVFSFLKENREAVDLEEREGWGDWEERKKGWAYLLCNFMREE